MYPGRRLWLVWSLRTPMCSSRCSARPARWRTVQTQSRCVFLSQQGLLRWPAYTQLPRWSDGRLHTAVTPNQEQFSDGALHADCCLCPQRVLGGGQAASSTQRPSSVERQSSRRTSQQVQRYTATRAHTRDLLQVHTHLRTEQNAATQPQEHTRTLRVHAGMQQNNTSKPHALKRADSP